MKKLMSAVILILVMSALAVAGCAEKESVNPLPEEEKKVVSSCVACHTDKDMLKELVPPELEEEKPEVTSGCG